MKLSQAPRAPFRKRESVLCPDDLNSARANPRGGSPGSFLEGEALFPCLAKPYDVDPCTNKSGSRRIAKGKRFKHSLQSLFGVLSSEVRLRARLGAQASSFARNMLLDLRHAGSMSARERWNAYPPVKTLGTVLAEVSNLDYKFALMRSIPERGRGVIARYRDFLPVNDKTPIVSLGEGDTPLIYCPRLSERLGRGCDVFVKNEGVNPTGSFKDRGMTVAVSKAIERGARTLICASTGNTSASAAAYAARAGISCAVILPAGKIATGKVLQAFAYGAKIVAIDGNFDDALRIVRELGERGDFAIVNSINPDRIAGQKTAAFEIVDVLGDAPDFHLLPVGNA